MMRSEMESGATIALHTLGCKLNQAETELLARQLSEAGYKVTRGDGVDICILNTCTVTHIADRKARRWLRLMRRQNSEALLVATGCYVERARDEIERLGAVDIIVGNKQKARLLELIQAKKPSQSTTPVDSLLAWKDSRVRTMVKAQDGCNDFCAYCIVPWVRGQECSLPSREIIKEVKDRLAAGYREVVLTGTKIGCYQCDGISLRQLIEAILRETNVERLRLSSLQPDELSSELLSLWKDRRLCRHFHLALQNGSDNVLQQMRRRYSVSNYRRAITLIREMVANAAISTDVMVGFPGESEADFAETYQICLEIGFARIHVFPYSPRPGTLAAKMPEPVAERIKIERADKMLGLSCRSAYKFQEQFLGQELEVLWEKEVTPGSSIYSGLTDNYIRVFAQSREPLTNKILSVRLIAPHQQGMWGEIAQQYRRRTGAAAWA